MIFRTLTSLAVVLTGTATAALPIEDRLAEQRAAYEAEVPKTIVDLQLYRHEQNAVLPDDTPLQLVSLNPNINSWFLLGIGPHGDRTYYHLENPLPDSQAVSLETGPRGAELLITEGRRTWTCTPWSGEPSQLALAQQASLPFAPICNDRLYLRVQTRGNYTSLEATSQFLRDNVWGGEAVVDFIKGTFNQDKHALDGVLGETGVDTGAADGPPPARVRYSEDRRVAVAAYHTFDLVGASRGMATGIWYPVKDQPGVFASAMQPRAVADDLHRVRGTNWIDEIEGKALAYFVAFDLSAFELGYARGTEHPRLDWSERPPLSVRPPGLPGPDGVEDGAPLVSLGMASPYLTNRLVATFTGGFKRSHGAFRSGPLRDVNYGSHYGLLEHGVIFSKLWPGLSTLYVAQDGTVGMKSWEESDNEMLPNLAFARQNGTPLVQDGQPGPFVTQWLPGNWSGSAEADLRTLRAGACLVNAQDRQWLIYGYFSTATPSAMTKTFMAYGCDHAMLLDMNAQEHTYLALYTRDKNGGFDVSHMHDYMADFDKKGSAGVIPRFVGFPDNRDVFYLTRKE